MAEGERTPQARVVFRARRDNHCYVTGPTPGGVLPTAVLCSTGTLLSGRMDPSPHGATAVPPHRAKSPREWRSCVVSPSRGVVATSREGGECLWPRTSITQSTPTPPASPDGLRHDLQHTNLLNKTIKTIKKGKQKRLITINNQATTKNCISPLP